MKSPRPRLVRSFLPLRVSTSLQWFEQRLDPGRSNGRPGVFNEKHDLSSSPSKLTVIGVPGATYFHYVFDLWAKQWRGREARGHMIVVRYADDLVAGFEHEADRRRFWVAMRMRFEQFGLELHGARLDCWSSAATRLYADSGADSAGQRPSRSWGSRSSAASLGAERSCSNAREGANWDESKASGDQGAAA
jgi:hypothetical protein